MLQTALSSRGPLHVVDLIYRTQWILIQFDIVGLWVCAKASVSFYKPLNQLHYHVWLQSHRDHLNTIHLRRVM